MQNPFKYISAYPPQLQQEVQKLIEDQRLEEYLRNKYPDQHSIANDKALREYVMDIKNQYLRKSEPLSQITYDNHIHVVNNALGLHTYASRVQGDKLKRKNEIRISSVFKKAPHALLGMIVAHELAHLKEKDHNKNFYLLCEHMQPNYHQLEFDTRLFLTMLELGSLD